MHRLSQKSWHCDKIGFAVTEFEVGDRILCSLAYHRCRICADCLGPERDTQYCQKAQYLGVNRNGSFSEYEVVDGRECCMLPVSSNIFGVNPSSIR